MTDASPATDDGTPASGTEAGDESGAGAGTDPGDASDARAGTGAAGGSSMLDRLLPLFDHTHDMGTTALVVVFATVLGLVASWIAADFGVRLIAYVVGVVGTGYLLYGQPTRRAVLAAGFYSLAALLAIAPVFYELGLVVAVDQPLRHLLSVADLLVFVLFWIVAAVPALVANRIASGPFLARLRARLAG
jgi:hypothetical protein